MMLQLTARIQLRLLCCLAVLPYLLTPACPVPPCPAPQVVDVSTSKTGKHGHAKCAFVAVDIFTGEPPGRGCACPGSAASAPAAESAPPLRSIPLARAGCSGVGSSSSSTFLPLLLHCFCRPLPSPVTIAGKKMEDLSPSSHNVDVPHVSRTDYTLLDIGDDGFVSRLPPRSGMIRARD